MNSFVKKFFDQNQQTFFNRNLIQHFPDEHMLKNKLQKGFLPKEVTQIESSKGFPWFVPFLIALITVLFYLPVLHNGFINWDDPISIIQNYPIRSFNLDSLKWMFTSFHTGNWIPLTWLSLALDYAIGKLDPRVYHLHNLLLHIINTLLVFFLSLKILQLAAQANDKIKNRLSSFSGKDRMQLINPEIWAASLTALLFGLHPIHVESVAWATERKDLLFSLFFLSSLLLYLHQVSSGSEKLWKWIACWGLFALSLLSKSMGVTLPCIFLLLDAWPLQRIRSHFSKVLLEKIPFFLLSLAIAILTIFSQAHAGAMSEMAKLPLDFRIMNAFHSLIFYMWKMVVPIGLVPLYPMGHQGFQAFSDANVMAAFLVILISLVCFYYRKTMPYLVTVWLYYIITLLPVLGIIQVGSQAAADRYTYIPSISLFLLFSATAVAFLSHRVVLTSFMTILVGALGFLTIKQIAIWKESISLWESAAKAYPDLSIVIHANLGNAYNQFGQTDQSLLSKALREYNRAIALRQPHAFIYDGKGIVLLNQGHLDEAIEAFHQSIALDPNCGSPHRNLWFAYERKGLPDLALASILESIRVEPTCAEAYNTLGISYGRMNQYEKSIDAFQRALAIDPENSKYLINLATTYQRCGKLDQSIEWYKKGIVLNANESIYFLNLANTYLLKGMVLEAIEMLKTALRLEPQNANVFQKLAIAYEMLGQKELAMQHYEKALHLHRKNK